MKKSETLGFEYENRGDYNIKYRQQYNAKNKENLKKVYKLYYESHKKKVLERSRKYQLKNKEKRHEIQRRYYWKHREEESERHKKYNQKYGKEIYQRNKLKHIQWLKDHPNYRKEFYRKNRIRIKERDYYRIKNLIFDKLGRKCVKCGFSDERALQFDHINGEGYKDRKVGQNIIQILKHIDKFQVLCANCNSIKKIENNELPYRTRI